MSVFSSDDRASVPGQSIACLDSQPGKTDIMLVLVTKVQKDF